MRKPSEPADMYADYHAASKANKRTGSSPPLITGAAVVCAQGFTDLFPEHGVSTPAVCLLTAHCLTYLASGWEAEHHTALVVLGE